MGRLYSDYRDLEWLNHYDQWKTTEPEPMPSAGDICSPVQEGEAWALYGQLRDYRLKYGTQAFNELCAEASK